MILSGIGNEIKSTIAINLETAIIASASSIDNWCV